MLDEIIEKTLWFGSSWLDVWLGGHLATERLNTERLNEIATFALLICFFGLAKSERHFPKIAMPTRLIRQSFQTNLGLFALNNVLASALSIASLFVIAEKYSGNGLLSHISDPVLQCILAFLSMDFLLYAWHWACHRLDLFWLFHRVHHNDPYLNISTAFRLHFTEMIVTNCLKALLIVVMGIDKMLVLALETMVTLSILFHHSNISFRHESILGKLLIVPYLHRLHHSTERAEHDSNYGAMLSVWDRLFGTFKLGEPKKIGIKGDSPQDVLNLVMFGLGIAQPSPKQCPATANAMPYDLEHMIAEAAYYKAEKRQFQPGDDWKDWLEAQAEIKNRYVNQSDKDDDLRGVRQVIKTLMNQANPVFKFQ